MNKFIIFFFCFFTGCSLINRHPDIISIDAPMELATLNSQNIDNTLSVSVRATARAEIPEALQLLSRLTALKERDVVGDALYVFPKKSFKNGDTYEFTISVSSPEITDYQLTLLWGEEASRILSSTIEKPKIENLQPLIPVTKNNLLNLTEVETLPAPLECSKGRCKTGVMISGNLKNTSSASVDSISLGVVLIDNDGKELGPEEVMALDSVVLPPTSETPFEVGVTLPEGISATDASAKVRVIEKEK